MKKFFVFTLIFLFYFQAQAVFTEGLKNKTRLGFGLQTGMNVFNANGTAEEGSPSIGFEARIGFRHGIWIPGVFTSGRYTYINDFNFQVDDVEFDGDLNNRLINYGLESRWEWKTSDVDVQYVLARVLLSTSSLSVDPADVNSNNFSENEEIYFRGTGLALGYGRTFKKRFFIHGYFQWVSYDRGLIIERKNDVNDTLFLGDLLQKVDEYSFILAFGLHNIL